MHMPSSSGQSQAITAINVTPVVDVMLVLLVIFMVTAKLGDRDAVPLDLPSAASGQTVQRIVAIAVDADGARTVDGVRQDDDAALRALLRARHASTPDLRCVIEASRRASHGDVMRALDSVRLAGIAKVAFAVERER
jgi:biopolymer transport protein ExbD